MGCSWYYDKVTRNGAQSSWTGGKQLRMEQRVKCKRWNKTYNDHTYFRLVIGDYSLPTYLVVRGTKWSTTWFNFPENMNEPLEQKRSPPPW